MKTIYSCTKKVLGSISALMLALTFTACEDFLSITPTNDIVLEKYWTEEADVNSVVNSCYAQLENPDCISRMIVWGELRSDNMINGSGASNDILQILKENLLETNSYTKWDCFYQCINRCNTVLYYAPGVNEIDPNFTDSELRATLAEVTVLRALCYFYLIRAYRDVPYVTQPSIDDNIDFMVPATKFEEILDNLISDVEAVKENAVRSYGEKNVNNTTRITRWAAYALLADLYLWKGNYQACIENCNKVIDHMKDIYEDELEDNPSDMTLELYGEYPLISECPSGSTNAGNTYSEIFGKGNSLESIFELNFLDRQSVKNSSVANFYGGVSNTAGQISAPSFLLNEAINGNNPYFKKTDCRFLENMREESSKVYISKYVYEDMSFRISTTGTAPSVSRSSRDENIANWIIYRFSDVLLMKAEAEVELAGDIVPTDTISEEQTKHYRSAFSCVSAIWKRANNKRISTTDTLIYGDYAGSRLTMENLIFDERQREFMFEGKRWFDFVRMCRRDGDNNRMIQKVLPKFEENSSQIRIKLSSEDALFFPYNRQELKINTMLHQNPAYVLDDSFTK